MKEEIFKSQVDFVNMELEATEPDSIETYDLSGKTFTGYRVQSVIDAVNNIFKNDWKYDIVEQGTVEGKGYWVAVQLSFLLGTEWRYRGVQFGSGSAVGSDGDSRKAAISDAIKKSLAMWSIGNKPYLGKLIAGENVIIRDVLNPLIQEVLKQNDQLTEKQVKTEVADFLFKAHHVKPQDLDSLPKDLQEHILTELKKRVSNMAKELI